MLARPLRQGLRKCIAALAPLTRSVEVMIFGLEREVAIAAERLTRTAAQTKYLVLVAKKQWTKVAEAIKAGDDALIVEGYPAYEPRHAGITMHALSVTTKKHQQTRSPKEIEET